ncbi:kinase-like domain-containing protein, partial [Pyrenochaeta sp. MPI-SDFR-AT-0127]
VDEVEGYSKPFRAQVYARKTIWISPRNSVGKLVTIQNEVEVAKQANHPLLVRLVATYVCGKEFAMIMEPVAEQNLGEYLEGVDGKCLDAVGRRLRDRLPPWFGCLVSATNYLHLKNIRHRDIKPKNILILGKNVLLTDFGISKELSEETLSISTETRGSPRYRAPEVDKLRRFGLKADIFSLGTVFLEMITVYDGHGQLSRLWSLLQGSYPATYSVNLQNVFQWTEALSQPPRDIPWYPTMLYLIKSMLQPDRIKRPTAIALRQCWSSLEKASKDGHALIVDLLLEKGADMSDSGALFAACQTGQKEVVELLLSRGANTNTEGVLQQASAALHRAAMNDHKIVARLLIEHGADINADNDHGRTPLHLAAKGGHNELVQLLIQNRADTNAVDNFGRTPLHLAARHGHLEVVRLL